MATRYSLNQIDNIDSKKVFFDANVLIYIFFSSGRYHWEENYARAYGHLLESKLELCFDFLVISEIVNRAHRIAYDIYCSTTGRDKNNYKYKEFRNSSNGKDSLKDIYITIEDDILANFTVLENAISYDDIKNYLIVEPLDFVDKAILQCCKKYDCVLITNDSDYKDSDIDILTSLPVLLNN